MNVRIVQLAIICLSAASSLSAQVPGPSQARSHIERFTAPAVRAERIETDTSARIASNPNDAEALNSRAYARMSLGRYPEAAEDLRRAVGLKPGNAEYHAGLGYALWKIGRHTEAIEIERKAINIDDKNFTAHYQLGRFLLFTGGDNKGQLAEAATHLRRALEIDPRRSEVRFDLLTVYRTLGDAAQAIAQLKLLENARPSDPRVTYIDALLASDRGDLNAAIHGFREALRQDPTLHGAWQDLGLAYIKLERWKDAADTFAELLKRQPNAVEASYFHALALYNTGRVAEAERETRRTLRLDAGASAAHILLGIILASRGGADAEASEALLQAVALAPNSFDANFYLGRVQYAMRDYAVAAQSLRTATKLDSRHGEARFFLGTALEAAGDSQAALIEYQKLIEIDPQSAIGQVGLGALLIKQGKVEEAIAALKNAVNLEPKSFEARWAFGRALSLAERFAEAVESLQVAVALMPDRPDAHYQLGLALKRLGRAEEANRHFAIVNQLNTSFRTNAPAKP